MCAGSQDNIGKVRVQWDDLTGLTLRPVRGIGIRPSTTYSQSSEDVPDRAPPQHSEPALLNHRAHKQ